MEYLSHFIKGSDRLKHLKKVQKLRPESITLLEEDYDVCEGFECVDDDQQKIINLDDALDKISELENDVKNEKQNSDKLKEENENLIKKNNESLKIIEDLRERYFFSLTMAMKLERNIANKEIKVNMQQI